MTFLRNAWYMAAWCNELSATAPLARRILGESLVFYRTESNAPVALQNRCPHRAVPLDMGTVRGEHIRCPYHGLEFDGSGVCRLNPHIKGSPEALRVRAYPLVERHGMVWIWMGDAAQADPARIPDYSWFERDGERAVARGYTYVQGGYRIMIDNLLDLSHAEYIHPNTVGTPGASGTVKTAVAAGPDSVTVKRKIFNLAPSAIFRPHWTRSAHIDQVSDMTWRAGTNLLLDIRLTEAGDNAGDSTDNGASFSADSGFHFPSAHILCPEGDTTTHYFWAVARNFKTDDVALTAHIRDAFEQTFTGEDKPIIEAIQRVYSLAGGSAPLANFTIGDAGSLRARRMLDALIDQERQP